MITLSTRDDTQKNNCFSGGRTTKRSGGLKPPEPLLRLLFFIKGRSKIEKNMNHLGLGCRGGGIKVFRPLKKSIVLCVFPYRCNVIREAIETFKFNFLWKFPLRVGGGSSTHYLAIFV